MVAVLCAAAAVAGTVAMVVMVATFWPFTVDDTYITLRYGRHFADGLGPSWNPGEVPAEGYTSMLWMIVASLLHRLPGDPVIGIKLASLSATAATFLGLALLSTRISAERSPGERVLAVVFSGVALALSPATAAHAVSGMETAAFAGLLVLTAWAARGWIGEPDRRRRLLLTSGLGLLLGLVRPEGNLAFCAVLGAGLLQVRAHHRRAALGPVLLLYGAPALTYFAWRWSYYGHFFPLPFYVKTISAAPLSGVDEARAFLIDLAWGAFPIGAAAAVGVWRYWRAVAPAAVAAAALFVFFLFPAPLMAYDHRYLYPLLPLVACWAGLGMASLVHGAAARIRAPAGWPLLAGASVALPLALAPRYFLRHLPASIADKTSYAIGLERAHVALGRRLRHVTADLREPPVLAMLDAGATPYLSDWSTIDTFGLNDPHVARKGRDDPSYVLARAPDLLVVISRHRDRFVAVFDYEGPLHAAARARGYEVIGVLTFLPDYHLWLMAPRNGELARRWPLSVAGPKVRGGSRGGSESDS